MLFVAPIDWLRVLRFRNLLSFVIAFPPIAAMPPNKSPCDVYEILDWCEVYDECLEPKRLNKQNKKRKKQTTIVNEK